MKSLSVGLVLVLQLLLSTPVAEGPGGSSGRSGRELSFQERIVAGGTNDFMLVKHLVLRGSNFDIGRKLAEIARDEHGAALTSGRDEDRLKLGVLERYMARHFPIHHERLRGVAAFHGLTGEKRPIDFSGLFYNLSGGGCSVVFYPPRFTDTGKGVLSRNYDFSTGTLDGREPPPGHPAATSRPYVLELHPDRGYASIAMCAYDLVGGALDGINSEGLCVALLADDESAATQPVEPAMGTEVGLYELNIPRFLLDNAANCEEAKELLLSAKHYYSFTPCHYIVADRHGSSFVWEYSYSSNKEYVIDGGGRPQVVTNHPLYRRQSSDGTSSEAAGLDSYERFSALSRGIESQSGTCSLDFIKRSNAEVAAQNPASPPPGRARGRTLWHALYYPEERRAEIDFYLGDRPDAERTGQSRIVRSGYHSFALHDAH
jgi:hypothetical protein